MSINVPEKLSKQEYNGLLNDLKKFDLTKYTDLIKENYKKPKGETEYSLKDGIAEPIRINLDYVLKRISDEEKGLTERVDARSYEERGIDKIPMVHEGPNVQAMEARGISTALGSLNRLIRALNDMKERAKNLLQWSLLRQSQLMERMLSLHQPTLADYLRNYYDKRNAVAESYAYGTQKAKNTNLKQFAETIRFLEEQDVRTPEQLTEKA